MDYDAWSSVWKTDGFLAVCCRITGAASITASATSGHSASPDTVTY